MKRSSLIWRNAMILTGLLAAVPATAQDRQQPDRSDPAIIERELERDETPRRPRQQPRLDVRTPTPATAAAQGQGVVVGAIRVSGASRVPTAAFAPAIEPFLGRPLVQRDLVALATAVATVARRAGYGLATAWVPAQDMADGVLVVEIEEGRIDAIRVTGPAPAWWNSASPPSRAARQCARPISSASCCWRAMRAACGSAMLGWCGRMAGIF
jgi:hemolysin activation/secretion protein